MYTFGNKNQDLGELKNGLTELSAKLSELKIKIVKARKEAIENATKK